MKKLIIAFAWLSMVGCSSATKPSVDFTTPQNANESRDPAAIEASGDGDDYRMETCGLPAGSVFKILKNGSELPNGGRTDASGCLRTSFRNGLVRAGDNLVIQVDGKNRGSETVPQRRGGNSNGGGGNNNGGGQNPSPNPGGGGNNGGGQTTYIPEPVSIEKVRNQAENNARCMANAVVATYGKMERFRYNFHRGLREGVNSYNWQNMGALRDTPEYEKGLADGQENGSGDGVIAGRKAGVSDGDSKGRTEARQRYVEVVDRDTAPNLTVVVPASGFGGLSASNAAPRTVEERLRSLDGEVRSWISSQDFSYDGWAIDSWSDRWSPSTIYGWNNYQGQLVNSWYRDDWAFDLWRQRRFARCSQQVNYYDTIRDPSQTGNAAEAERVFRTTFKGFYDRVIDDKWNDVVQVHDEYPYSYGRNLGYKVSRDYARDMGYYNGYRTSYSTASLDGHSDTFGGAYQAGFDENSKYHERNMVLESPAADIKSTSSTGAFGAGSSFNLTVKRLVNIGRQKGDAKVSVTGNVAGVQSKSIPMDYSRSLKAPVDFPAIGSIGFQTGPLQSTNVTVNLGNQPVSFNVTIDWDTTIRNFIATTVGSPARVQFLNYMKQHLAIEWESIRKGVGDNKYNPKNKKSPPNDTLLERMTILYGQLSDAEKTSLRASAVDLKAAIGKRSGGWLAVDDKAKWDAASALYDKLLK